MEPGGLALSLLLAIVLPLISLALIIPALTVAAKTRRRGAAVTLTVAAIISLVFGVAVLTALFVVRPG
ncbi:MAG TPA: hypothetical protein VI318_26245 [Baekduia sp.]